MCKIIENLKFYVKTCVTEILRKKNIELWFSTSQVPVQWCAYDR